MLRFDGIYVCFNELARRIRIDSNFIYTEPLDVVLQFYKQGQVRFGEIPHHFDSSGLRNFIINRAEKKMGGFEPYRKVEYFYLEWFYDLIRYFDPQRHIIYLSSLFRGGIYHIEGNQIRIIIKYFEGKEEKTIKHSGVIKKDCLDLEAMYPASGLIVDELYEFVAFHY